MNANEQGQDRIFYNNRDLQDLLVETMIENFGIDLHEFYHTLCKTEKMAMFVKIPDDLRNNYTDALSEACADLLALAIGNRLTKLIRLFFIFNTIFASKSQSSNTPHVLAAKIILSYFSEFELGRDEETVAKYALIEISSKLSQIADTRCTRDLDQFVIQHSKTFDSTADTILKRSFQMEIAAETFNSKIDKEHMMQSVNNLLDDLHSNYFVEQGKIRFETTRLERKLERFERTLAIRFITKPGDEWEKLGKRALQELSSCQLLAYQIEQNISNSDDSLKTLKAKIERFVSKKELIGLNFQKLARVCEYQICIILSNTRENYKQIYKSFSSKIEKFPDGSKLNNILLEFEKNTFEDLEQAAIAADNFLNSIKECLLTSSIITGYLHVLIELVRHKTSKYALKLYEDIVYGRTTVVDVITEEIMKLPFPQISESLERNYNLVNVFSNELQNKSTIHEWIVAIARLHSMWIADSYILGTIFKRNADWMNSSDFIKLLSKVLPDEYGQSIETIFKISSEIRIEQFWALIYWEPLFDFLTKGELDNAKRIIDSRSKQKIVKYPNWVNNNAEKILSMHETISMKAKSNKNEETESLRNNTQEQKLKQYKFSDGLDQFFNHPDMLKELDDNIFDHFVLKATLEYDFMFKKGYRSKHFGSGWPGATENQFALQLVEENKEGQIIFLPDMPIPWRIFGRTLIEEHVARSFMKLSEGILADMLVHWNIYSNIWNTFGEFNVFQMQAYCKAKLKGPDKFKQRECLEYDEVNKYRGEIAQKICNGNLMPITRESILNNGIVIFGIKYDLASELYLINHLFERFDSSYFLQADTKTSHNVVQYILMNIFKKQPISDKDGIDIHTTAYGNIIAISPTISPKMLGWGPG